MNTFGKILFASLFIITLSFIASDTSHAEIQYSHEFENGVVYAEGTPQYDDWISFRASLPTQDVDSITLSGSRDPVGRTCTIPGAAQQIADALRDTGAGMLPSETIFASVDCDGFLWRVIACDFVPNNVMLKPLDGDDNLSPCSCEAEYALGPGITDGDWGGIDGPICSAPSQTITVTVRAGPNIRPIPTLSEWGLIAAAGLMGIIGLFMVRKRKAAA